MKVLMYCASIFMIFVLIMSQTSKFDSYEAQYKRLKDITNECSEGGSSFNDQVQYSNGYWVYRDSDIINHVRYNLEKRTSLNSSYTLDGDSFWNGPASVSVYIIDDSNRIRHYRNGILQTNNAFTYGSTFTESITGESIVINQASIVVSLNFGKGTNYTEYDVEGICLSVYENDRND